jgi:hypothetical protein
MSRYQRKNIAHSSLAFDNTPEETVTIVLFYGEFETGTRYWTSGFFGAWHNLPESIQNKIAMINLVEPNELVPALGVNSTRQHSYTLFNVEIEEANKLEGYFDAD